MRTSLNLQDDGVLIRTTNYPMVLGVTFDTHFKSTTAICDKITSRIKVVKSLAGIIWEREFLHAVNVIPAWEV